MSVLISILSFLLVLGVLVVAHEAGHFLAAKAFRMAVPAFSVGFGPMAWKRRVGETEYQLRWLPLGGFVQLAGEEADDPDSPFPPDRWFSRRPRWQRALVLLAGPAANILLAWVFLSGLALTFGARIPVERELPPVVGWVQEDSPAGQAGLKPGDRILRIADREVGSWEEAETRLLMLTRTAFDVEVERAGETLRLRMVPRVVNTRMGDVGQVGLAPMRPAEVGALVKDGPAHAAGIHPGDTILAVGEAEIHSWYDLAPAIQATGGRPVDIRLRGKDGGERTLTIAPRKDEESDRFLLGIQPPISVVRRLSPADAAAWGWSEIRRNAAFTWNFLRSLATRQASMNLLSGPVGIAYVTGEVVRHGGLYTILEMLATLSIQLGLFNLLPIPLLDGGQLTVLGVEGLVRRNLPQSWKTALQFAGLLLLGIFFLAVVVLDVGKLL